MTKPGSLFTERVRNPYAAASQVLPGHCPRGVARLRPITTVFPSVFACLLFLLAAGLGNGEVEGSPAGDSVTVLYTVAKHYEPLAWMHGGERFPAGAMIFSREVPLHTPAHNDSLTQRALIPKFAASTDAAISFDGLRVLFSGKRRTQEPWQIWEIDLASGEPHQITFGREDHVRPFYLPGDRIVCAHKVSGRFVIEAMELTGRKSLQLTYGPSNYLPTDVLRDGRILFEAGYPLGAEIAPEIYTVYSDGTGIESYRCDHGNSHYQGRQISSGNIVFASRTGLAFRLAQFISASAHEVHVDAPAGEYAGDVAEMASGDWLLPWRPTPRAHFQLVTREAGAQALRVSVADPNRDVVQPVVVAERIAPKLHPSGLHDWPNANLLCLNAYTSKSHFAPGSIHSVRLYSRNERDEPKLLGTAPVERDGSFFVQVPSETALQIELLDNAGKTLKREAGFFWMRRGEQRVCVGCHAGPETAPENAVPMILLKSTIPADATHAKAHNASGGRHGRGSPLRKNSQVGSDQPKLSSIADGGNNFMLTFMRRKLSVGAAVLLCFLAVSLRAQTAQFLWEDSSNQGSWISTYGADGYNVIGPTLEYQNYPSYATVTPSGQTENTWSSNTQDVRALQVPGQSYRMAASWYSTVGFTIDINLTDGQTHQVAVYCLDWDRNGRAQVVSVLNAQNGAILDSRTLNAFQNGQYLVWNLSGHVQIQATHLAGANAVISGLFFSPVGAPVVLGLSQRSGAVGAPITVFGYNFGSSGTLTFNGTPTVSSQTQWSNTSITAPVPAGATSGPVIVNASGKLSGNNASFTVLSGQTLQFLGNDGSSEGSWEGVYGGDGYNVINLTPAYPSYATVTPSGEGEYTWTANTQDVRALQVPGQSYRTAAAWCDDNCAGDNQQNSFTIGVNLTDGNVHEIAVYCLDWDNQARVETVSILNPQTGAVLDSHTISSFTNGQYLAWNLSGNIEIKVTDVSGPNAVISGLFFSPVGSGIPSISGLSQNVGAVGTPVTILGTNFGSSGTLAFNGTNATPTSSTSTSITAPVPVGATTGNVTVAAGGKTSNGVPFTVVPVITGVSPTTGPLSTVVQISGTGFGSSQGSTAVQFNGITQTPGLWTSTQVNSDLPNALVPGPVYVTIGESNPAIFTLLNNGGISGTVTNAANGQAITGASISLYVSRVLLASTTSAANGTYSFASVTTGTYSLTCTAAGFTTASVATVPVQAGGSTTENIALSTPNISALSPSSGPVGTIVTISGVNFGAAQGSSTVTFAGTGATPTQWSNTAIVAAVPAGGGTGSVIVTVGGGASNGVTFTVGTGIIQGTVTSSGSGVSGATVNALQSGTVKASATSGSGGSYSISNLAPGTYDMEVTASNYGNQAVKGISVTANNATTENFALSSPGTISGTVTQSNGTTDISGATVNVNLGYTVVGTAMTSSSGTYSVATLAPGTYTVTATSPGFDGVTKSGQKVTSGGTTTVNFSLASQPTINYEYDEAGRLKAVVDSLNNGVLYNYDAAGNILSIIKKAATALSITDFVPARGPVGTTVTINGAGFSTTASQDAVTFHSGVAATVTSATSTQLVTTVPAGATTGTIKVTVGSSSATSSTSFTVTSSNGLPTITSFTPSIASAGTAVSIIGTNFDPTASNDQLTVNVSKTYASSATGTTALGTSIPGVVSTGHVTVTTTVGSYTTQSYLFVPPSGYTTAQVGYTGQVKLGGQVTATLGTANQIGLVAIDVAELQGWSIAASNNFASSVPYTVYDPYGNVLGSGSIPTGTSALGGNYTSHVGTCTIMIAPGNQTGNVVLSPSADFTASLTVPSGAGTTGPVVQVPSTGNLALGQSAILTFNGAASQVVSINLNSTIASYNAVLYDPHSIAVQSGSYGTGNALLGPITLTAGSYRLYLNPQGTTTGNVAVSINNDQPVMASISIGGSPVTVSTIAGQSANLSFSGSAGQIITVQVSNGTYPGCTVTQAGVNVAIFNPDQSQLASYGCLGSGYLGRITLRQSGLYRLNLWPGSWTYSGSMTFTLYNVVDDDTTITAAVNGGPPVTVTTGVVGEDANATFSGTSGERIALNLTNGTYPGCGLFTGGIEVSIFNPDTSVLEQAGCLGTPYFFSTVSLAENGTYTIQVNPYPYTGSVTLTLYSVPPNVSGSISIGGSGFPFTTVVGQSANITFSNPLTQNVTVQWSSGTYSSCNLTVTNSSNQTVGSTGCQGATGSLLLSSLPSGSYNIAVNPPGTNTGGMTISAVTP